MTEAPGATAVVIAVGNRFRRDDGAGGEVLAEIGQRFATDRRVRLLELDGEPVRLMQAWEGVRWAWVVDAVATGAPPGTVHRMIVGDRSDWPTPAAASGHALGVGEAVSLARALDRLPPELRIVGIEGADFGDGVGLSLAVAAGCASAAALVVAEIEHMLSSS